MLVNQLKTKQKNKKEDCQYVIRYIRSLFIRISIKSSIKPKFNGVYSKNDQPKVKDGVYAINLDEFKSIGTH